MKYKVGDKVKVVKKEGVGSAYFGMQGEIVGFQDMRYIVKNVPLTWTDSDLTSVEKKETLFDKIVHSIVEAAKQSPVMVEQTEDGGVKISPLEEKPKPRESGIYHYEDTQQTYVVFGGGIHVAVWKNIEGYSIGLQTLNEIRECGADHNEEWVKEKPSVHLIINNKNTIKILRDALDIVENKLNKEE